MIVSRDAPQWLATAGALSPATRRELMRPRSPSVGGGPGEVGCRGFGEPDALHIAERHLTAPAASEVQVEVAAAAVNPVDVQTRGGRVIGADDARFPMVLGWDVAGTITSVGEDAGDWQVGDRVAAMVFQSIDQNGTYAQHINLAADLLATVPDGLDLKRAATVPLAGLTAAQLVAWVGAGPDQTVVVDALGAVGSYAIQLAAGRGATVIAVAKPENREAALALGAQNVVERGDFAASVRELYPAGVDAAIDVVGREVGRNAMASVRDGGALASIFTDYAGTGGESLTAEREIRLQNPLTVQPDTAELGRLLDAARRGELRTEVAHTYPLARAADAHRRQAQGGLGGRLILVP